MQSILTAVNNKQCPLAYIRSDEERLPADYSIRRLSTFISQPPHSYQWLLQVRGIKIHALNKHIFYPMGHLLEPANESDDPIASSLELSSSRSAKSRLSFFRFGVMGGKSWRNKLFIMLGMTLPLVIWSSFAHQQSANHSTEIDMADVQAVPSKVASLSSVDAIKKSQTLRVATVMDTTTYFAKDGFEHGFGYDVMRGYAEHLAVKLATQVYPSTAAALQAVQQGRADIALTTAPVMPETAFPVAAEPVSLLKTVSYHPAANDDVLPSQGLQSVALDCGKDYLQAHGLNSQLNIQMRKADGKLSEHAQAFLCSPKVVANHQRLAAFYTAEVFDDSYSEQHFIEAMQQKLPIYRGLFKQYAKEHQLDWQLLVAMGYQESHLDPDATSPTGVRGIMMLTNDTANAVGVNDRIDPVQSIQGGAKYMAQMVAQFDEVPSSERIWFALAAYNMGPQAVKNIQANLSRQDRDGNNWAEVYKYMTDNQKNNSRYTQCIAYVTNIRGYLELLKTKDISKKSNRPNSSVVEKIKPNLTTNNFKSSPMATPRRQTLPNAISKGNERLKPADILKKSA